MFDFIKFSHKEGEKKPGEIVIFALSTCGFCKSGMEFLDKQRVTYDYIYVDDLPLSDKSKLREEFNRTFGSKLVYPTLVFNGKEVLKGFIKPSWEQVLGLDYEN